MVSELLAKILLARVSLAASRRPDSLGRRESGQILIRLLYCILSSRAPNEVGVNINWDTFCKGRSSVSLNSMPKKATACLHSSLTQLTRQEILGMLEMR